MSQYAPPSYSSWSMMVKTIQHLLAATLQIQRDQFLPCTQLILNTTSAVNIHCHPQMIFLQNLPHVHYLLTAPILVYVLGVIHLHCYPNLKFHPFDQIVHHYKVLFMTGINVHTCLFAVGHQTNQIICHRIQVGVWKMTP